MSLSDWIVEEHEGFEGNIRVYKIKEAVKELMEKIEEYKKRARPLEKVLFTHLKDEFVKEFGEKLCH